ncbi:MAG: ABC transporter substrate-binding protein [Acetobacteraceae bacterium]|nr:ABC transporter substrate-binding protein [Acetobacteraceae bacterium]
MLRRRTVLTGAIAAGLAPAMPRVLRAADTQGVTATEIRIGNTMPYSGPASAYGVIGKTDGAVFQMINDQGGFAGRKVTFTSYDDGYSPPKAVEQVRRLVEQDQVACLFNTLGTPTNTAIVKYCNAKKLPQLFVSTGADKWGEYKEHPWTIGWQPSYRTEAQIYGKYILTQKPDAKIGILYQNDDFGKDYIVGLKDVLGDKFAKVTQVSYETSDATVDSQLVSLQSSGIDVLVTAATPKFAAQTIRKVAELNWKPMHFMTNVSASVGAVIEPAGSQNAVGIISSAYLKDPTDPAWNNDPGMNEWRAFMKRHFADGDTSDSGYVFGYGVSLTMAQVLKQCGSDFSRQNIMKQVTNLKDLDLPVLLPGIKINTSPTNYRPIRQLQLMKWTGKTWGRFGDLIEGAAV